MDNKELLERILTIQGWGNFSTIHKYVFDRIPTNSISVELGVASGRGLATMAVLAREKSIKVYGVDHFLGTKGESRDFYFNEHDGISKSNVIKMLEGFGIKENEYNIIVEDTSKSASLFSLAHYVFLDADHSYNGVCSDIDSWWPKIPIGGFIGGHDWPFNTVQRAVKEKFDNYQIFDDCWLVKKAKNDTSKNNIHRKSKTF